MRETFRKLLDRRGVSPVISAIIMTGVVVTLSFVVFAWAQTRTSDYAENYGETTNAEIAKLKERLTVEYIFYDGSSGNLSIYLLNCGAIGNVTIESVRVQNDAGYNNVSLSPSLKFLDGTPIPDQDLDRGEEGYLILPCGNLTAETYYFVNILTERRSLFDSGFEA